MLAIDARLSGNGGQPPVPPPSFPVAGEGDGSDDEGRYSFVFINGKFTAIERK